MWQGIDALSAFQESGGIQGTGHGNETHMGNEDQTRLLEGKERTL